MELNLLSKHLRRQIIDMYYTANAGHIACSLSCIDVLANLFTQHKEEEDKFILSKGHAAVALYAVLHFIGKLSKEELQGFYQDGTTLPAHPAPLVNKEIPFATGSLGHGLPIANGIAKSNLLMQKDAFTYVLMSDGETNEGTCWEAAHFAVQHSLHKLIVFVDKNKIQGFGRTEDVLGDTAKAGVWKKIGFEVWEIDGHNHDAISKAVTEAKSSIHKTPKLIITNTIKGKGVSYMENTIDWHYWPMDKEKYNLALQDIERM